MENKRGNDMNILMLILIGFAAALIIMVFFANDKKENDVLKPLQTSTEAMLTETKELKNLINAKVKIWGELTEKNAKQIDYLNQNLNSLLKKVEALNQHHEVLREKQIKLQEILSNKRPVIKLNSALDKQLMEISSRYFENAEKKQLAKVKEADDALLKGKPLGRGVEAIMNGNKNQK